MSGVLCERRCDTSNLKISFPLQRMIFLPENYYFPSSNSLMGGGGQNCCMDFPLFLLNEEHPCKTEQNRTQSSSRESKTHCGRETAAVLCSTANPRTSTPVVLHQVWELDDLNTCNSQMPHLVHTCLVNIPITSIPASPSPSQPSPSPRQPSPVLAH